MFLNSLYGKGSSPLARGLLGSAYWLSAVLGIIPARAGSTDVLSRGECVAPDHPRSRGVYRPLDAEAARRYGSSPLARGLQVVEMVRVENRGIIPARAGSTTSELLCCNGDPGSSPLARGLLRWHFRGGLRVRIIPARAGSTEEMRSVILFSPDHPRSRGVYWRLLPVLRTWLGSSPLARGLHVYLRSVVPRRGIIPARAGSTIIQNTYHRSAQDHPRSRGVYPLGLHVPRYCCGSSPLARGLRADALSAALE